MRRYACMIGWILAALTLGFAGPGRAELPPETGFTPPGDVYSLPQPTPWDPSEANEEQSGDISIDELAAPQTPATHGVVYDEGWTLRPYDSQATPFELKLSSQNQFRHTGFATDAPAVVNSAGQLVPTPPRNTFDIDRGRLIFSGYALDPSLQFYLNVDYNTVADEQFQILMGWIRHEIHPAFNLRYGLAKVPGTWEWLEPARLTQGSERSLATTFFRPSITAGIWLDGEPLNELHYELMVGNGFNTLSLQSSELDTHFAYAGMLWWEPLGDFGAGYSDFEHHEQPALRVGNGYTRDRPDADPRGVRGPEQTQIRLSDGTLLVETGALAPGVTVRSFDISLYAVHGGWKHRGWSLSGEYFLRRLSGLQADGPIPQNSIFDHGFNAQAGKFVVPQSLEVFARGSAVFGPFGDGLEVGGGLNWFVSKNRNHRFTCDVARLQQSSAQQDRTGFQAGASGVLFRTQFWVCF